MKRKVWATMTECFELIDRKLLKGPWVMGEQYTICDPRMAAGYSADEKARLLSGTAKREFPVFCSKRHHAVAPTGLADVSRGHCGWRRASAAPPQVNAAIARAIMR
jgi:glutathione S-transferase